MTRSGCRVADIAGRQKADIVDVKSMSLDMTSGNAALTVVSIERQISGGGIRDLLSPTGEPSLTVWHAKLESLP